MGAKAKDGSKKKGVPKREQMPTKLSEAQREVQALYSKALERGDDEAVQQLGGLVGQKHSGAACLALAKVHLQQAVAAELGSPPDSPVGPQVVELLLRALRVAVEGLEAHNSLQCAVLAGSLAVACHACLGSPGDSTQLAHRLAAAVGLNPQATLKELQKSAKNSERVIGTVVGARQWAHPQEESLPEDRRQMEWDGQEAVAEYRGRTCANIAYYAMHSLAVLKAQQGDHQQGLATLKGQLSLLEWLAKDGPHLLRPADLGRLMEHFKEVEEAGTLQQAGGKSMKREAEDAANAFSDVMVPGLLKKESAADAKRKQQERTRRVLAEKNLAGLKAKAAMIFCYLRKWLREQCLGGEEGKGEDGDQWAVQVEQSLKPRLRALLSMRLDELQALLEPAALKGKQKADVKEAQEMAGYLQLLLEWGALHRPCLHFKFPNPPSAPDGEATANVGLGADADKLLLAMAVGDAKGLNQQGVQALNDFNEMSRLGLDNVLGVARSIGLMGKLCAQSVPGFVVDEDRWRLRSPGDTSLHIGREDVASVLSRLHAPEEAAGSSAAADEEGTAGTQAVATRAAEQAGSPGGTAEFVAAGEGSRSQASSSGSAVGEQPTGPATPHSADDLVGMTVDPMAMLGAACQEGQLDPLDKYLDQCLVGDDIAIIAAQSSAETTAGLPPDPSAASDTLECETLLRPTAVGWALLGVAAAHRSGQLSRRRLLGVHRTLLSSPTEDVLGAWQGRTGRAVATNASKHAAAWLAALPSSERVGLPDSNALPFTYPAAQQLLEPGQDLILDLCLAEALVGRGRDSGTEEEEGEGEGAGGSSSEGQKGSKSSSESQGGGKGGAREGVNGGDSGRSCDVGGEASSSGGGASMGGSSSSSSSSQWQRSTLAELWQQLGLEEEDVQGPVLRVLTERVKRRAMELVCAGLAVLAARGRLTALRLSGLADFLLEQHEAAFMELGARDPFPERLHILRKAHGRKFNPSPRVAMQEFRTQELVVETQELVATIGFLPLAAVIRTLTFVSLLIYKSFSCPADMWPEIQALYAGCHMELGYECSGEVVSSSSDGGGSGGSARNSTAPGADSGSSGKAGTAGRQGAHSEEAVAVPESVTISDTLRFSAPAMATLLHWMPPAGGHSALQGREEVIEAAAASVAACLMNVTAPACGDQASPAVTGTSSGGRSSSAGSSKQAESGSGANNKLSEEERAMVAACKSLGLDWNAAYESSPLNQQAGRQKLGSVQRLMSLGGLISQITEKVSGFVLMDMRMGGLVLHELHDELERGEKDASQVLLEFEKHIIGMRGPMLISYRVGSLMEALNKCFEAVTFHYVGKTSQEQEEACRVELAKRGLSAEQRESLLKQAAQAKRDADQQYQELRTCLGSVIEQLKVADRKVQVVDSVWEKAYDAVAKVLKSLKLEAPRRRQFLQRCSNDPDHVMRLASLPEEELGRESDRIALQALGAMVQRVQARVDVMLEQINTADHFREAMYFRICRLLSEVRAQCHIDLAPTLMTYVATSVLPARWEQELQEPKRAESQAAEEALLQLMLEEEELANKRELEAKKKQAAAEKKKAKKAAKKATQAAAATATAEGSQPAAAEAAAGSPAAAAAAASAAAPATSQGAGEGKEQGQAPADGRAESAEEPARAEELAATASRAGGPAELRSPLPPEVGAGKEPQQQAQSSGASSEQLRTGSDREGEGDADWRQVGSSKMDEDDAGWQQVGSKGGESHQSGWRQVMGSKAGSQLGRQQVGGSQGGRGGQQAARSSNAAPWSPVTQRPTPTASPAKMKPKGRARVVWWDGNWECVCGKVLGVRDWCNGCNHPPPCRDYLMGTCTRGASECWYPHPALDLPTQLPPPGFNVKKQAVFPQGQQAQRAQQQDMRIVSWLGHWVCRCGRRLSEGKPCRACLQDPPCSLWLQGRCNKTDCQLPHPPFSMDEDPIPLERTTRPVVKLWPGAPKYTPPSRAPQAAAQQRPQLRSSTAGAQQPAQPVQQAAAGPAAAAAAPPLPAWVAAARRESAAGAQAVGAPLGAGVGGAALPSEQEAAKEAAAAASSPSWAGKEEGDAEEDELNSMLMALGVGQEPGEDTEASLRGWGGTTDTVGSTVGTHIAGLGPGTGGTGWGGSAGSVALGATASSTWRSLLEQPPAAPYEAGISPTELHSAVEPASPAATGLTNEAGEYNCFLNVIIQCLWHCAEFRRQVSSWPEAVRQWDPIVCALADLFAALEAEEMKRGAAGGLLDSPVPSSPSVSPLSTQQQQQQRSVVNPNPLREALSALPGELFRVGEMSDASEVLLALYDHINASTTASAPLAASLGAAEQQAQQAQQRRDVGALDAVFGLGVSEYVHCGVCGKDTHANRYTQYFYNTQATALRLVKLGQGTDARMAQLLRIIEQQTLKSCDTDEGGCDVRNPVVHVLEHAPRVFTLQLAWESQREEAGDIAATLEAVDEQVDLAEVYCGLEPGQHLYRLRSLVCYYGAHYQAFVLLPELESWVMIDDTRVSRIGSWADVRRKCELGRIQPSVLFYEAE